jgi:hypothetical protein
MDLSKHVEAVLVCCQALEEQVRALEPPKCFSSRFASNSDLAFWPLRHIFSPPDTINE